MWGALDAAPLQEEAQLQQQQLLKSQTLPGVLGLLLALWHMPTPHSLKSMRPCSGLDSHLHNLPLYFMVYQLPHSICLVQQGLANLAMREKWLMCLLSGMDDHQICHIHVQGVDRLHADSTTACCIPGIRASDCVLRRSALAGSPCHLRQAERPRHAEP